MISRTPTPSNSNAKSMSGTPSTMTLYGIAAGVIVLAGTIVTVRDSLFPEPLAPCTARFKGGLDFPHHAAGGQPVDVREVQTKLSFDEWGLIENVKLEPNKLGPFRYVLDIALPEGISGQQDSRGRRGGVGYSWKPGIPNGATSACLSYGVRMPANFDFDKGGVLPGLFGGDEPRAGRTGFAARLGWGRNGAGDVVANIPVSGDKGVSLAAGTWTFPTGRWSLVEQEVRLNTPGQENGFLGIWVDGQLRVQLDNVAYRSHAQTRINGIVSDVFYLSPAPADTSLQLTSFNLRWQ